jgi:sterol desaturase/sphingolipid hydroxylase (fatty acid hydroxylase superfamily)
MLDQVERNRRHGRGLGMVNAADTAVLAPTPTAAVTRAGQLRAVYLPTVLLAAAAGWLAWSGWNTLSSYGQLAAVRAGQLHYAGPVVLSFVLVVLVIEQVAPAQRRPILARGHLLDLGYLAAYAIVVLPLVTLLGAGFATLLEQHAGWLVLPRVAGVPSWCFVVIGLLAIDATDWLVHLVNHRFNPLWRFHSVHHSQEELSVLTTFRAHPLVHLSFVFTAVPGFVLAANSATPVTLLTAYACLGALPHANVRWTYGPLGRVFISPAYHRAHHRDSGRLDVNLGVVFPFWDALSGRAIFPSEDGRVIATGLGGRPIPVEQEVQRSRLARVFAVQWIEPFRKVKVTDAN